MLSCLCRIASSSLTAIKTLSKAIFRSYNLALENLALRQQLASVCTKPHPQPKRIDRIFWVILSQIWPSWKNSLAFVTPETVVRWHRLGFRLFWRFKSTHIPGRPPINKELRDLIADISRNNITWGAPRIHAELLKLGFKISQASVARYMLPQIKRTPTSPNLSAFLKLHLDNSVGVDFFDIPTATFDVLKGFIVLDHKNRKILHFGVTKHPTAEWTANQITETFPFNSSPRFLFRDRDAIYGERFRNRIKSMNIKEVVSAPRSPWQNPFAERAIGSVRRELLDHVIILNERHALRLLREYQRYYNAYRPHLSLNKDSPDGRPVQDISLGAKIIALPVLGGLHHRYERRAA